MKKDNYSVMLQGCASSVGKSLLTAGLCRIIKQDGHSVAPFKSQNMALNSYITKEGLEMGRAQVVQAEAADIEPCVEMNPILLKPTSDKKSQIIINGKVSDNLDFREYHKLKPSLKDMLKETYQSLERKYEYIVLEGAGSPAEINLRDGDIVNMGMAEIADAPVILIGDIDKGGVFAFLAGTVMLLTEAERSRVKGVIINKFRGDVSILEPGLKMLEDIIKIPVLGVVPYMEVDIDDEDSVSERLTRVVNGGDIDVAVIRLPHLSNYTDYNVFSLEKSITLRYVKNTAELGNPDVVILPGTKNTIEDLLYLKAIGMDEQIVRHAKAGKAVIGVCGGYQMLADSLYDPYNVESNLKSISGLGLLDMKVTFGKEKTTAQAKGEVTADIGVLSGLKGCRIEGYEIHMGENAYGSEVTECIAADERNGEKVKVVDGVCNVQGNVFGSYIHGLFDSGAFLRGIINNLRLSKGYTADTSESIPYSEYKTKQYDKLADILRNSLDIDKIYKIMRKEV